MVTAWKPKGKSRTRRPVWGREDSEPLVLLPGCVLLAAATILVSCPPVDGPVAGFRGSPRIGEVPLTVQFVDLSVSNGEPITTTLWEFGDGTTSIQADPTHTYTEGGTFTVSLTVGSASGSDTLERPGYITATLDPEAAFSVEPRIGRGPLEVAFLDESEEGTAAVTEWLWDFGDGTTSSEQHPSHVYSQLGSYDVSLTITSEHGTDTVSRTRFVEVKKEIVFGGPGTDYARCVAKTMDGGYLLAGATNSHCEPDDQDYDMLLIKTDGELYEDWRERIGSPDCNETAVGVVQTSDGGYVLAASRTCSSGNEHILLVKTDTLGVPIWEKTFTSDGSISPGSLVGTSDSGFLVLGSVRKPGENSRTYLLKTDAEGGLLWDEVWEESECRYAVSALQASNGDLVLAGRAKAECEGEWDMYLLRTDASGGEIWAKTFGGEENDFGQVLSETADGGFIVVGGTASFGGDDRDRYVVRTDDEGDLVWQKALVRSGDEYVGAVVETPDGGFAVLTLAHDVHYDHDLLLVRLDKDGDVLWERTYGGDKNEMGYALLPRDDGGFVLVGSSESLWFGGRDVYVVLTDSDGNELPPFTD